MPKFYFSNRPKLEVLSRAEIEYIHFASLKLLEEVGVEIHNDATLRLLADAGVEVDFDNKLARILQHLVKKCLVKAPSTTRLYSCKGKYDQVLEGDGVTYNPGSSGCTFLTMKVARLDMP